MTLVRVGTAFLLGLVVLATVMLSRAPTPTPVPTPTPSSTVRVTSIPALLTALANDTVTEIVVANGTYRVSVASTRQANSLWIGAKFAGRTRPVLVRAETTGGVTFDGGGSTYWVGLAFNGGAHDQTWQGFTFANAEPTQTGVITFGQSGLGAGWAAPHHITLRDIKMAGSLTSRYAGSGDHCIYFSQAVGGPHDILIDGYTVDGSGNINTALTFYHSTATEQNAWNVTVRNMTVTGTHQAIEFWDATLRNIVVEDSTITNATRYAVRYEVGGTGIVLRRVVSTGSGNGTGFYSSLGKTPPGVTFEASNLR